MDATRAGFHAAGDLEHAAACAPSTASAGHPHLLEHLAQLIADHPTDPHNPTR
jgi:hypothetical protein